MQTLLVVISNDRWSDAVMEQSIILAHHFEAKIILLHTIHVPFWDLPRYKEEMPLDRTLVQGELEGKMKALMGEVLIDFYTLVYFGEVTDQAILEAKREHVDLIVSSPTINVERFVTEVFKPLILVRNQSHDYKKIVIPTDLSDRSKVAIAYTKRVFQGADIQLLYCYESMVVMNGLYDMAYHEMENFQEENQKIAFNLFEKFKADVGLEGTFVVAPEALYQGVLEGIEGMDPDLVVVARGRHEGLSFGSVSAYIARETPRDVLVYG